MRVIATDTGYDNIAIREKGDIFDMPPGSSAPWFKPYKGGAPATAPEPADPNFLPSAANTLSTSRYL